MPLLGKRTRKQNSWELEKTGQRLILNERRETVGQSASLTTIAGAQTINYFTLTDVNRKASFTLISLDINPARIGSLTMLIDGVTYFTYDSGTSAANSFVFSFKYEEAIRVNRKIDFNIQGTSPDTDTVLINSLHILEDASTSYYVI